MNIPYHMYPGLKEPFVKDQIILAKKKARNQNTFYSRLDVVRIVISTMNEAYELEVTLKELKSRNRKRPIPYYRFACWYWLNIAKRNVTLRQSGSMFGHYDHTSVLHGIGEWEGSCSIDSANRRINSVIRIKINELRN